MLLDPSLLATLTGIGVAGMASAAWGFWVEPGLVLRVKRYRLSPPSWRGGPRLRIVALSDFHAGRPHVTARRMAKVIDRANALRGDIVLLLGDFLAEKRVWCRPTAPAEVVAHVARLGAPLGVHAILGNHDFRDDPDGPCPADGPLPGIAARLEAAGIRVYDNDAARLVHEGRAFWLAGLGDQRAELIGRRRYRGRHDLAGTLARITDDAPVLLMAHEPDIHPLVPARVALTLSGHTHAGQVRLFGYSPITPSDFGNRFAYGHIVEDGRDLIVSGGLGTSLLPVRFGAPPEIVVIELGG